MSPFGGMTEEKVMGGRTHRTVTLPEIPFHMNYEAQAAHLESMTNNMSHKLQQSHLLKDEPIYTCDTRIPLDDKEMLNFFPVYNEYVNEQNPNVTFTGRCWDFDVVYEKIDYDHFDLHITTANKQSTFCYDNLFFANTEIQHVESFYFEGEHTLHFTVPDDGIVDMQHGGLKMWHFCGGFKDTFISVFHTVEAFVGGLSLHPNIPIVGSHTPPYMEKANLNFIEAGMGFRPEERPIYEVQVPESEIHSGDFLVIQRLDGLDPMIMYGTGSRGAHCTMALWFDGELYIVESQDAWYWPTAGIQRTPYKQWLSQAADASFNVILLPMSPEAQAKFDEKKANDWFFETEGLPYGYHNFLFGWMDTQRDNLPPAMANELLPVVLQLVSEIAPKAIENLFVQALDKRLGNVGCWDLACIATHAAFQGMSIQDVIAIPEQDGWLYTGLPNDGQAFVCSAYSAAVYKAAGMYDDFEVNATEFTPRDVYMLDFFDANYTRPQQCIDADPNLPYCQLLGKYRIDVTGDWN